MRMVVLAPHADDETLGMGGTIAKMVERGDDVTVLLITHHEMPRSAEFRAAAAVLGCKARILAEYPNDQERMSLADGYLGGQLLGPSIDEVVQTLAPQRLYIPAPSQHQDHRTVYEIGLMCGRVSLDPRHLPIAQVLVYDEGVSTLSPYPAALDFCFYERLDKRHLEAKIHALEKYRSQVTLPGRPSDEAYVSAEAVASGAMAGVGLAERFTVRRWLQW